MKKIWQWLFILIWCNNALCTELSMRGTLFVISCSINNDKTVEVDFGDAIGVNKIDGIRYRKPIPITIICSREPGDLLHLIFSGTPTNFDESALATNNDDLGIKLLQNDTPIPINKPLQLDEDLLLDFFAVPVKRVNSKLNSGDFSSLANLLIQLN